MLAMLDMERIPKRGIMGRFGQRKENGISVRRGNAFGSPILYITLGIESNIKPRTLEKLFSSAEKLMSGQGVDRVCFSDDFEFAGHFIGNVFKEPDLTPPYEAVAGQAAEVLPGAGGTAFITASKLGGVAHGTLMGLCKNYRYVLTDIDTVGAEAFRNIQRRLGISIVDRPLPDWILGADAAVFLGARREETRLSYKCAVFSVNRAALSGVRLYKLVTGLDVSLPGGTELPEGFPKEPVISYALERLTLPQNKLTLRRIKVSDVVGRGEAGLFLQLDKTAEL